MNGITVCLSVIMISHVKNRTTPFSFLLYNISWRAIFSSVFVPLEDFQNYIHPIYCLAAYRLVIKFCVFHIILISWSNVRYCMHDWNIYLPNSGSSSGYIIAVVHLASSGYIIALLNIIYHPYISLEFNAYLIKNSASRSIQYVQTANVVKINANNSMT